MEKQEIHIEDIRRILIGEAPGEFLFEVLIRTLIIYAALLVAVRLMGKRMVGQLSVSEMAVMLTLGAIVSPGMQMPSTGLLLGILILLCTLGFQRGLNYLEFIFPRLEVITQGRMTMLVRDGGLVLDQMAESGWSKQQLFAVLRSRGIYNLGRVERIYLEASGFISVYLYDRGLPGLSVLPAETEKITLSEEAEWIVCSNCGAVKKNSDKTGKCLVCGERHLVAAVAT